MTVAPTATASASSPVTGAVSAALPAASDLVALAAAREVGVAEVLSSLPPTVVAAFAALTQLGDAWLVFSLAALLYWRRPAVAADPRRAGAVLVAAGLVALALSVGLKSLFALPRPPGAGTATPPGWLPAALDAVYENAATGDGFGFPSGHAIATTVVYGTLATVLDRFGSRGRRVAVAAALVVAVALSRLVLGVHYLADVVAGVAAGLVGLAALLWLAGDPRSITPSRTLDQLRAFAVAGGLLVVAGAVAVAGGHAAEVFEAVVGLGAAVGGSVAWLAVDDDALDAPAVSWPAAILGLVVAGGAWAAAYALATSLAVGFLGSALAVGGVVAYPVAVTRATEQRRVEA